MPHDPNRMKQFKFIETKIVIDSFPSVKTKNTKIKIRILFDKNFVELLNGIGKFPSTIFTHNLWGVFFSCLRSQIFHRRLLASCQQNKK